MSLPVLTFAQKSSNCLVSTRKQESSLSSPGCCLIRLNWPHQHPPLSVCVRKKAGLLIVSFTRCAERSTHFFGPQINMKIAALKRLRVIPFLLLHAGSSFMKTPIISRRLRFLSPTYATGIAIWSIEPGCSRLLQRCFRILGSN